MAQIVVLLSLLRKLASKELNNLSSIGLNNFFFCLLFLVSGSRRPSDAFWTTLFFQLVLLAPLLVTFSIDTQHRLPKQRVLLWPLTEPQRFLLTTVSFIFNPLFAILFLSFLFWMGLVVALIFLFLGLIAHLAVFLAAKLAGRFQGAGNLALPGPPIALGGIVQSIARELIATLDFWTALLVALAGTLYRLFGRAPQPDAFPILSLVVAVAFSTVTQRLLELDEGRAILRYRLLPVPAWKILLSQDATYLVLAGLLVLPLNLQAGLTFSLVALAIGRFPSLKQRAPQRRWRFVSGDIRFGIAQILLGGAAGLGAARLSSWFLLAAVPIYLTSVFAGQRLWDQAIRAQR